MISTSGHRGPRRRQRGALPAWLPSLAVVGQSGEVGGATQGRAGLVLRQKRVLAPPRNPRHPINSARGRPFDWCCLGLVWFRSPPGICCWVTADAPSTSPSPGFLPSSLLLPFGLAAAVPSR